PPSPLSVHILGYDGGDCCACTCESAEFSCGDFACVDPDAPCVDDDDITIAVAENCGSPSDIGNGVCEQYNNKAECGKPCRDKAF
ncbi:unnamed protein product, partial [Hapterophycus canaliculatus]